VRSRRTRSPRSSARADEGERAGADGADDDVLGLGALVVAAGVVEPLREPLGQDPLDRGAAVEEEPAVGVADAERAAAEGVEVAVDARGVPTQRRRDLEPGQLVAREPGGDVQVLDAGLLRERVVLAASPSLAVMR
jgi:hypothetical protein